MVRPKGFQTFLGNKNGDLKINEEKKSERTHFIYLLFQKYFII